MTECAISLAFSTYQAGKLFLVGVNPVTRKLSVFERTFERCMGLHASGNSLYLSSLYQIWRMENALQPGQRHKGLYDRVYVPQVAYTTGDLDVHDMALDKNGDLLFVNTLFNCLAHVSLTCSFRPVWRPPFISRLAAEDRCHLNGLAMKDGEAAYVTAISRTDIHDGWREHRANGGIVVDVQTGEIVCEGLSMPHSPRYYRDKLWLHDSGNGQFGYMDVAQGRFEPVCFCPGYLRGLAFVDHYAIVGLSRPRHNHTFEGLALDGLLAGKNVAPRCAIQVIDLQSGDIVHELRLEGIVEELYDIVTLQGVQTPMAIGVRSEEICNTVTIDEA